MPPKASSNSAGTAPLVDVFKSIGLTQAKAAEAAKSPKSATTLRDLIEKYELVGKLDEKQAGLVAALAVQLSKSNVGEEETSYVVRAILDGRLKSVDQANGTFVLTAPFPPIVSAVLCSLSTIIFLIYVGEDKALTFWPYSRGKIR